MIRLLSLIFLFGSVVGEISFSNGTIHDYLIYINDNVPIQNDAFINKLKTLVSRASYNMFLATNDLAPNKAIQFGQVYIRVPNSWSISNTTLATWQQCTQANVYVTTKIDNMNSDKPFTKQLNGCGSSGEYSSISVDSVIASSPSMASSSIHDREFVKEFYKYRYGVYDETPFNNQLFKLNQSTFTKFTCPSSIAFLASDLRSCIIPNTECTYTITKGQTHNHSIMTEQNTSSNLYICNNGSRPHNSLGSTIHNKMCDGNSVGSIMLKHSDFSDSQNIQSRPTFREPEFFLVKEPTKKYVFILDVSGSMSNAMNKLIAATSEYLTDTIEDSAEVGLVTFSGNAEIKSRLLLMNNTANRKTLTDLVSNLAAGGNTNIGDGLNKGIEVLGATTKEKSDGEIYILSDGAENVNEAGYRTAIETVISKGIVSNCIYFGTSGDANLNRLCSANKGLAMYVPTNTSYVDLVEAYSQKIFCASYLLKPIIIVDEELSYSEQEDKTVEIGYIDEFVGYKTKIRLIFNFSIFPSTGDYAIIDPDGTEYTSVNMVMQSSITVLTFKFTGKAKKGKYKLKIKAKPTGKANLKLNYIIQSSPDTSTKVRVISPVVTVSVNDFTQLTARSKLKLILDTSTCGIDYYNEYVAAGIYMFRAKNTLFSKFYRLADDGIGDDDIANDGIFSTSIYNMDLAVDDYYSFKAFVRVINVGSQTTITRQLKLPVVRVLALASDAKIDLTPPAKITDLRISIVSVSDRTLALSWTAVGDNGMQGEISTYELMISDNKANTTMNVNFTGAPGSRINSVVTVDGKITDQFFKLSIRGVDNNGNKAEYSSPNSFTWSYDSILSAFSSSGMFQPNYLVLLVAVFTGIFTKFYSD